MEVEVLITTEVVVMETKRDKKTGVDEVVIVVVVHIVQMLNVTIVTNMNTMQRSAMP